MFSTAFESPRQNNVARSIPSPISPLKIMLVSIEYGMTTEAFRVSSDIYRESMDNSVHELAGRYEHVLQHPVLPFFKQVSRL